MTNSSLDLQPCATLHVLHETDYLYDSNVSLSRQLLHLTPRAFKFQQLQSHQLQINPVPNEWSNRLDYFGNLISSVSILQPHQTLHISAEASIILYSRAAQSAIESQPWEYYVQRGSVNSWSSALEFAFASPHIPLAIELASYAHASFSAKCPIFDATYSLMQRIKNEFEFDSQATNIATPLLSVFNQRRGVCQDFAHVMIGCLRSIGLAARYVSGYILTNPPEGQPRLIGCDASHAWVSVYMGEELDWVDFDPTNGCLLDDKHITLGWGRDFSDVTPVRGVVLGGGEHALNVRVTVRPDHEVN